MVEHFNAVRHLLTYSGSCEAYRRLSTPFVMALVLKRRYQLQVQEAAIAKKRQQRLRRRQINRF